MPLVDVHAAKRRVLSPGTWRLRIDKSEFAARGKTSPNPVANMEFVTTGQTTLGEIEGGADVRLYHTQALQDKTAFSTVELLAACFGEVEGDEDGKVDVAWGELVDIEVWGVVTIESYQGRSQNRITHFYHVDTPIAEDGTLVIAEEEVEMVGAPTE